MERENQYTTSGSLHETLKQQLVLLTAWNSPADITAIAGHGLNELLKTYAKNWQIRVGLALSD